MLKIGLKIRLGAVHERHRQSRGERGLSSADISRTKRRDPSGADVHTLLVQKPADFSKFMVCPHGQGGRGS